MANEWIVLDTSVIREAVRGNAELGIDLDGLARLRGARPVSLSQTAWIELTNQLSKQRFTFAAWEPVARALDKVLDPEHPIVPMGIALRVMLGTATADIDDLERGFRGLRAMWNVLKLARCSADLDEGRKVVVEGERREFKPAAIKQELDDAARRWIAIFVGLGEELGRALGPDDRPWLADQIRDVIGVEDIARAPELETVVGAAVEWAIVHGRRMGPGSVYRPSDNPNHAMDFHQLFVLGLPAILCTSDGPLIERVRVLGTPGSDRVLKPRDLLLELERQAPTPA